jgi:hypothetical protein
VADIIIDAASSIIECKGAGIGSIIRIASSMSPRIARIDGISVVSIPAAIIRCGAHGLCRGRSEELGLGTITNKSLLPSAWGVNYPTSF